MFIRRKKMSNDRSSGNMWPRREQEASCPALLHRRPGRSSPCYGRRLVSFSWRDACRWRIMFVLVVAFNPGEDFLEIRPGLPMIGGDFQEFLIMRDGFPVFAGLGQAIG